MKAGDCWQKATGERTEEVFLLVSLLWESVCQPSEPQKHFSELFVP